MPGFPGLEFFGREILPGIPAQPKENKKFIDDFSGNPFDTWEAGEFNPPMDNSGLGADAGTGNKEKKGSFDAWDFLKVAVPGAGIIDVIQGNNPLPFLPDETPLIPPDLTPTIPDLPKFPKIDFPKFPKIDFPKFPKLTDLFKGAGAGAVIGLAVVGVVAYLAYKSGVAGKVAKSAAQSAKYMK